MSKDPGNGKDWGDRSVPMGPDAPTLPPTTPDTSNGSPVVVDPGTPGIDSGTNPGDTTDTDPVTTPGTTTNTAPGTGPVTPPVTPPGTTTPDTPAPGTDGLPGSTTPPPPVTPPGGNDNGPAVQIDLPDFKFDSPVLEPIALETAPFTPSDTGTRYTSLNHEGTIEYTNPEVSVAWNGVDKAMPLAKETLDGGTRYHYINGTLDDMTESGGTSVFNEARLATSTELIPKALDGIQARYVSLVDSGTNLAETAQLGDYMERFSNAINTGDKATLQAVFNTDFNAWSGGDNSALGRMQAVERQLDPTNLSGGMATPGQLVGGWTLASGLGAASMMVGGATLSGLLDTGAGGYSAGVLSGIAADGTMQLGNNAAAFLTNGQLGEYGFNGKEFVASVVLGGVAGALIGDTSSFAASGGGPKLLSSQRGTLDLEGLIPNETRVVQAPNRVGAVDAAESTTGLDWSRTSPRTGGDAADHVIQNHGSLSLTKPNQGVFYGDPIATTEDAWAIAQRNGTQPVTVGNRDIYVIDRPNSGYSGGYLGQLENLDHMTIITETGTNRTVTAFPSGGTPPIPKGYQWILGN